MSWRSALTPLVAILGVPVGVVFIIVGVVTIKRGRRVPGAGVVQVLGTVWLA